MPSYRPPVLDPNMRKELTSIAYLTAVAAKANCEILQPKFDIDSVDAIVMPRGKRRLAFGVQLKATSLDCISETEVTFDLPVKNYHDLRLDESAIPTLLVILHLPKGEEFWIAHSEDALTLKNNAYYLNLLGAEDTPNVETKRISIPLSHKFTSDSLDEILTHLSANRVLPQ